MPSLPLLLSFQNSVLWAVCHIFSMKPVKDIIFVFEPLTLILINNLILHPVEFFINQSRRDRICMAYIMN